MQEIAPAGAPLSSALQSFRNKRASDRTGQPHPKRMRDGVTVGSTQTLEVHMQLANSNSLQPWEEFSATLVGSQKRAVAPPFSLAPGSVCHECSLVEALHSLRVFLRARALRESLSSNVVSSTAATLSSTLGEQPPKKRRREEPGKKRSHVVHGEVRAWGKRMGSCRLVWLFRSKHLKVLSRGNIVSSPRHDPAPQNITGKGRMHRMKPLYPEIEGLCSLTFVDPTDAGVGNETAPNQDWERRTTPINPGERGVALCFGDLHEEDVA